MTKMIKATLLMAAVCTLGATALFGQQAAEGYAVVTVSDSSSSGGVWAWNRTETYTYATGTQIETRTREEASGDTFVIHHVYDGTGLLVHRWRVQLPSTLKWAEDREYDAAGNNTVLTRYKNDSTTVNYTETKTYDANGNQTKSVRVKVGSEDVDTKSYTEETTYDANGVRTGRTCKGVSGAEIWTEVSTVVAKQETERTRTFADGATPKRKYVREYDAAGNLVLSTGYEDASGSWVPGTWGNEKNAYVYALTSTLAVEAADELPAAFALAQNYPNPFNPSTTISYSLTEGSQVRLTVYDILGEVVSELVANHQTAGDYQVVWNGIGANGRSVSGGIYFYRLTAGGQTMTRKMVFLK